MRGRGLFARLIRAASDRRERVRATHVGIAVDRAHVVEAIPEGVVCRGYRAGQVYRPTNLTPQERLRIAERARSFVGRPYGWGKILLHAMRLERLAVMEGFPICSWVAAAAYASEGYHFGVSYRRATPDDIEDFILAHPDRYQRVV
ncbi:MAG: hypothetical protein VW239_00300 [Candidatus Nanopelagicales bacterium]